MKERKIKRSFLMRITAAMKRSGWNLRTVYKQLCKLETEAARQQKIGWLHSAEKLSKYIWSLKRIKQTPPPFKLFQPGNGKLPFLSWSTLPGFNCPGAGSCWVLIKNKFSGWCYSVKAWRYPAAYLRQLQNTVLEQTPAGREIIRQELKKELKRPKYSHLKSIDLRLYVDGDFSSLELLRWWLDLAKEFKQLKIYGYSKSLHLFEELARSGYEWPTNYALNGSSGGRYENTGFHNAVKKLPIWRGNFEAVPVSDSTKKAWYTGNLNRDQRQELRSGSDNKKVFICPVKCGDCTAYGHACGDLNKFKDMTIVIPLH